MYAMDPMTHEHIPVMQRLLSGIQSLSDRIHTAESCGLDCQHHRAMLDTMSESAQAIARTYFPADKPGSPAKPSY